MESSKANKQAKPLKVEQVTTTETHGHVNDGHAKVADNVKDGKRETPALAKDLKVAGAVEQSPDQRYLKLNEEIGRGSFKTVFKGLDTKTGEAVAWCELQGQGLSREERRRLKEETEMLKSLKHPNIVCFYDFYDFYLVQASGHTHVGPKKNIVITELMTGGSLKRYLKRFKTIKPQVLKSWCRQILKGLMFLHTRSPPIIHKDLRCDNIFITGPTGSVKIGDLGLATLKNKSFSKSVIGTPEFMAPELYEEHYDEAVDVYAFGLCMLEMSTGEYPYSECSSPSQIYKKVVNGVLPKSLAKVESQEVREIIEKCLKLKKEDRPSIKELLAEDFFVDTGFEVEVVNHEELIKSDKNEIVFRLRVKTSKKDNPCHKANEAIEFDFILGVDDPVQITQDMVSTHVLQKEEDAKIVAKIMEMRIRALEKDRSERSLKVPGIEDPRPKGPADSDKGEKKRAYLVPRIKVLRIVPEDESSEVEDEEREERDVVKTGVKVGDI